MRLGIDLGGTKTEIIALDQARTLLRRRISTPKDYPGLLAAIAGLVAETEAELGVSGSIGLAIPGCEIRDSHRIKNANTLYLNAKPLRADLQSVLGRPVRLANDANCFALSEASDGAGAGKDMVFGVIAGTGVGGGIAVQGKVLNGAHGICGEWGHIPLPAMSEQERSENRPCYCGRLGCVETWCSGPAVAGEYFRRTGRALSVEAIAQACGAEERAAIDRLADRLARALATVVTVLDPEVIVLGGGLSNIERLYLELPPLVEKYAFNLGGPPEIVKSKHGDSSGVRGAAWLWQE